MTWNYEDEGYTDTSEYGGDFIPPRSVKMTFDESALNVAQLTDAFREFLVAVGYERATAEKIKFKENK